MLFFLFLLTLNSSGVYIILIARLSLGWWVIAGTVIFTLLLAIGVAILGIKTESESWEREKSYVVLLTIAALVIGAAAMISTIAQYIKKRGMTESCVREK